ncbi:MAG TPA: BTAD domain-containing putative transcriptional regulator [Actinophytocola sp.]|nr:BTAD domain-containing putative transcriptional regulator [Actinophytocola sp.]
MRELPAADRRNGGRYISVVLRPVGPARSCAYDSRRFDFTPRAPRGWSGDQLIGVKFVDMTFGILGPTALLIDGTVRENWGRPKERAVLGALLVNAGRWVSVDTLIEWAWPEEGTAPRSRGTFHSYATRIRGWLRQVPVQPTLHAGNGGYRLDVDRSLIDYHEFTRLVAEARGHAKRNAPRSAVASVKRALGLWRGRPLDDLAGEPARAWRLRWVRDDWLSANRTLNAVLLDLHEYDEVLTRVGELQADHPDDVALATQRMSALHALGRYPDETEYYFEVRRRLRDDGDEAAAEHVRRHHEGLLASPAAPDPAPPAVPPRQLGRDVPDFVGRADLLAALDTMVGDRPASGVVVLDGMPGVGKTALVRHWGHRARRHFPDGELCVNLNGFGESAAIPHTTVVDEFLIELGHPPDEELAGRARELLLARLLSGRRVLVVLDNARDAKHVERLVGLFPDALVLVTSRQRLGSLSATQGAHRLRVEPMPPAEASTLLALKIGNRREVAEADRARLAALCDGLPMMIALLAEYVANHPPSRTAELAARLDRRQLLLEVGEDGDGSTTGRAFLDWSYRALAAPERRLFRMLGLHPGPDFGVDAACAIDGRGRAETMRGLRTLVAAHLLEQPEALDRYRFHDLIREFAAFRAESDEAFPARQAAIRRVVDFYLASATHANRVLYPDRSNATQLAVEDGVEPVAPVGAHAAKAWFDRERTNVIATVRAAAANGQHDHVWRLADVVVIYFDRHGYYDDSIAVLKVALSSARLAGDRFGEASTLCALGRVHLTLGDQIGARHHLDASLRLVREMGSDQGLAATLNLLGKLEMQRGDPIAALELYRRGMQIVKKVDDPHAMLWTCCRLGEVLRVLEQHDEALVYLARGQILAERGGNLSASASATIEIGLVHRDRGDLVTAAAHCEQALGVAKAIPDLVITVQACLALAGINKERGDTAAALRFATEAIGMSRHGNAARAYDVLGDVHFANGDPIEAATAWRESAERFDQLGNPTRATVVRGKLDRVPNVELPSARTDSPPVDTAVDHDRWS